MNNDVRFNYIITIHNKEALIEKTLMSVLMCCRDNSHIYPVLDGCTDDTENIVDEIIDRFSGVPITKVHTPDVHELLSINAGLKVSSQEGDGFNIVLQDDVLLADFMLENKVKKLYEWAGPQLGYISFRMGANFMEDACISNSHIPLTDFVENACGHCIPDAEMLPLGCFVYRTVPIKSPVCIPFKVVNEIGLLEEKLAPYAHDDTEFAIRVQKAGYKNGVFAVKFYSDIKWGGTRINPHPDIMKMQRRNMDFIREMHGEDLTGICCQQIKGSIIEIDGLTDNAEKEKSLYIWKNNKIQMQNERSNIYMKRIKSLFKRFR